MAKKRKLRSWDKKHIVKAPPCNYHHRVHYRWSQLEADRAKGKVGSPSRPRRRVDRTLALRPRHGRPALQTLAARLRRQARFRMCAEVYQTIDYNTFSKNGVMKLTEVELYFLNSRITRSTCDQFALVYLGVGNGERFRFLRDEFFPGLAVVAFDPLDDHFAHRTDEIQENADRWNSDGTGFTFLLRCFEYERDIGWLKSTLSGKRLLFISDIRGINKLEDGATFDKQLDQEVQWAAIKALRPEASLVKFTFPDFSSRMYTYAPGTLLKQTFCYYGTAELRLLIDGVPEHTVEYDSWELVERLVRHHELKRGQVYRSGRRSDRAGSPSCLDHCFDCTVLWQTISSYAWRNSLDPYEVLDKLMKNHVYDAPDLRWSDVEFYLNHGRVMEAVAALEAEGPDDCGECPQDWAAMAERVAAEQPCLAERMERDLPRPASRTDLVRLLGSLAKPFTLVRTEVNGLLEYPPWSWTKASQLKMAAAEAKAKAAGFGGIDPAYYKKELCWFYARGTCCKGADCTFMHGEDDIGPPKPEQPHSSSG